MHGKIGRIRTLSSITESWLIPGGCRWESGRESDPHQIIKKMAELKKWTDLSGEEIREIVNFKPPRYYRWFYNFYQKYLSATIFGVILLIGILGIIHNEGPWDFWNILMGGFFFVLAIGLWALSSHLIKHIYTKKFARSMGLTMENWNYLTKGMVWK